MTHNPLTKMTSGLLKKVEDDAKAEGIRLRKPTHGKLRLIGTVIGVLIVLLIGLWMTHH